MVKGVEGLEPDLQFHAFPELRVFMQAQVPVVDSRSKEETWVGIAELPEGFRGKSTLAKPGMVGIVPGVTGDVQGADDIGHVDPGGAS